MDVERISCCGFDCAECPVRKATLGDDPAVRERCVGCRAEGVKLPFCEAGCQIRACVRTNGYDSCLDCVRWEDCPTFRPVRQRKKRI